MGRTKTAPAACSLPCKQVESYVMSSYWLGNAPNTHSLIIRNPPKEPTSNFTEADSIKWTQHQLAYQKGTVDAWGYFVQENKEIGAEKKRKREAIDNNIRKEKLAINKAANANGKAELEIGGGSKKAKVIVPAAPQTSLPVKGPGRSARTMRKTEKAIAIEVATTQQQNPRPASPQPNINNASRTPSPASSEKSMNANPSTPNTPAITPAPSLVVRLPVRFDLDFCRPKARGPPFGLAQQALQACGVQQHLAATSTATPAALSTTSIRDIPSNSVSPCTGNSPTPFPYISQVAAPAVVAEHALKQTNTPAMFRFRVIHNNNSPRWQYVTSERMAKIRAATREDDC